MEELKLKLSEVVDYLKTELNSVRTGRAHATLVEDLPVLAYGQKMRLKELASISVPDPQLIVLEPWDKSVISDIEKAVWESPLSLSPAVDGDIIRLPIPSLTEERRRELVRLVGQKIEEAREKVRRSRQEAIEEVRRQEKNKEISEDEKFRRQKEIQSQVDGANQQIETIGKAKEKEILRI